LLDGQPDCGFVNGGVHVLLNQPGDFCDCLLSVALPPDERGGLVQAMRFVAFEVVNENFIQDFSGDKISFSGTGLRMDDLSRPWLRLSISGH
jgi:hypothetical protein